MKHRKDKGLRRPDICKWTLKKRGPFNALKDDACRFFTGMKDITMDLKRPIKNKL